MIPLAKDVREAVGSLAEAVSNRALLYEKMPIPKSWNHPSKFADAKRLNVVRTASGAGAIFQKIVEDSNRTLSSPRSTQDNKEAASYLRNAATSLRNCWKPDETLAQAQVANTLDFLSSLERSYPGRVLTLVAELGGRLIINAAGGVMENAGMALDRCFGNPYIPGEAVKGVTRSQALWDIRHREDPGLREHLLRLALVAFGYGPSHRTDFLFAAQGDEAVLARALATVNGAEYRGACSFLPAQPARPVEVVADVLTPHHTGRLTPNFFPVVESGSSFGFAVTLQRQPPEEVAVLNLLEAVRGWLIGAITEKGVGGKSGAGYGWFVFDPLAEQRRRDEQAEADSREAERRAAEEAERTKAAAEIARLADLSPEDRAREEISALDAEGFAAFAKALADKNEPEQRAFLAVFRSPERKTTRKNWQKKKKPLFESIVTVANDRGITIA
ncbi:hypothetical protein BH23VER1_BH23VER1_27130 [soil metagenome]